MRLCRIVAGNACHFAPFTWHRWLQRGNRRIVRPERRLRESIVRFLSAQLIEPVIGLLANALQDRQQHVLWRAFKGFGVREVVGQCVELAVDRSLGFGFLVVIRCAPRTLECAACLTVERSAASQFGTDDFQV